MCSLSACVRYFLNVLTNLTCGVTQYCSLFQKTTCGPAIVKSHDLAFSVFVDCYPLMTLEFVGLINKLM